MPRIQQPVIFMRSQGRGHNQHAVFGLRCKFISDVGKFGGRGGVSPRRWKIIDCDDFGRQIARKFSRDQNQIRRSVVGIEMNEIFEHRQRLVLGGVRETSSRTRPAPAVKISTFTIQR